MSAGSQSDELVFCADVAPQHGGIRPARSGRLSSGGAASPPLYACVDLSGRFEKLPWSHAACCRLM